MDRIVVSLSGSKGSGKDTVGKMLARDYGFKRAAWADGLKDALTLIFGIDRLLFEGINKTFTVGRNWPYNETAVKWGAIRAATTIFDLRDRILREDLAHEPIEEWGNATAQELVQTFVDGCLEVRSWDPRIITIRQIMQYVGTDIVRERVHPMAWIKLLKRRIDRSSDPRVVITDSRFINELKAADNMGAVFVKIDRPSIILDDHHSSENEWKAWEFDHVLENRGTIEDLNLNVISLVTSIFKI